MTNAATTAVAAAADLAAPAVTAAGRRAARSGASRATSPAAPPDAASDAGNGNSGIGTTPASSTGGAPRRPSTQASSPLEPVAGVTGSGTDQLGKAIDQSGQSAAKVATPISPTTGTAVSTASAQVSSGVAAAGDAVAKVIRDIVPPPAGG